MVTFWSVAAALALALPLATPPAPIASVRRAAQSAQEEPLCEPPDSFVQINFGMHTRRSSNPCLPRLPLPLVTHPPFEVGNRWATLSITVE